MRKKRQAESVMAAQFIKLQEKGILCEGKDAGFTILMGQMESIRYGDVEPFKSSQLQKERT